MLNYKKRAVKYGVRKYSRTITKTKKLSQRTFADAIGVSYDAIGMWETNKRQPDLELLKKIATFYNVSSDYIFGITQYDYNDETNQKTNLLIVQQVYHNKKFFENELSS